MKRNKKQGDLYKGFEPVSASITVEDVCRIFKGKIITEKQLIEDYVLAQKSSRRRSGEELVKLMKQKGAFWWVVPRR